MSAENNSKPNPNPNSNSMLGRMVLRMLGLSQLANLADDVQRLHDTVAEATNLVNHLNAQMSSLRKASMQVQTTVDDKITEVKKEVQTHAGRLEDIIKSATVAIGGPVGGVLANIAADAVQEAIKTTKTSPRKRTRTTASSRTSPVRPKDK